MPKETFFNLNPQKQEKVIRSAIAEFMRNGFEKGNIGVIAQNADVAKGSLYQYFESKKELFIYAVQWTIRFFVERTEPAIVHSEMNLFDYFHQSSKQLLSQISADIELAEFIQDVLLGKYSSVNDESIAVMMKAGGEYSLRLVQEGKRNGSIRKDIDDHTISMFMIGASMKIKENILKRAKEAGANIFEQGLGIYESEIEAMIELLKNGMGERS